MTRKRFCPGCGKDIEGDREICHNCSPDEDFDVRELYFDYCERCKRFWFQNKWRETESISDAIVTVVTKNVKLDFDEIEPKIPKVTMAAGVNVDFKVLAKKDYKEYEFPGRFLVTICPRCSKDKTCYFEGILQLRNPKDDVKQYIEKRLREVKVKGIHATTVKEVRGGIDYYLSSRKFLRTLGKELKARFKGEFNESAQLFSRNHQTSKDIFRLNLLFRCE